MGRTCPGPMMAPGQKEVPRTIHWSNAMAGAGLLMLLDDIAAILDDVALMTKVAARKSVAMADDVSVMTKVAAQKTARSEEHTSELQSPCNLVCRLLLEKKNE